MNSKEVSDLSISYQIAQRRERIFCDQSIHYGCFYGNKLCGQIFIRVFSISEKKNERKIIFLTNEKSFHLVLFLSLLFASCDGRFV